MIFDGYALFNRAEFEATGLPSRTLTINLELLGVKEILITQGNELGVLYEGEFLMVDFADKNPNGKNGVAIFEDDEGVVWLGVAQT